GILVHQLGHDVVTHDVMAPGRRCNRAGQAKLTQSNETDSHQMLPTVLILEIILKDSVPKSRSSMSESKFRAFSRRFSWFWRSSPWRPEGEAFRLNARRVNAIERLTWAPCESAVIICDMWETHWCRRAAERCSVLAPDLERFARATRERGALVIHAPSDTMSYYSGTPQRERARRVRAVQPPLPIGMRPVNLKREAELPIIDSDGGCDDEPPSTYKPPPPWKRQHPAIAIAENDIISDDGNEIYSVLVRNGIKNIFMTGVHIAR